jgi:N-acetylmuramoyl-L-alanine amidase
VVADSNGVTERAGTITLKEGRGLLSSGTNIAASGFRIQPRGCAVVAAMVASVLLPIETGHAAWLTDLFKGGASPAAKSPAHLTSRKPVARARHAAAAPKHHAVRLASLGPPDIAPSDLKSVPALCDPLKFRIAVDVGHTAASDGAMSARNVPEFTFNLRLAQHIAEQLKAAGYAATRLIVTEGKAKPSLFKRVAAADNLHADLFLSIHHDAVPDKLLEDWEFEGKKSHFSDRFSGYSVWVSHDNPNFKTSLTFAEMVGREMKAKGLHYATQYTLPIMGHFRHQLLDKETGVYRHDELIVLRKTRMAAVLLEAGSIINRDEELKMSSPERQDMVTSAVVAAVQAFCPAYLGPP